MATRRDLTKKYAKTYQQSPKKVKGLMLDELCAATDWSRVNARRAGRVEPPRACVRDDQEAEAQEVLV